MDDRILPEDISRILTNPFYCVEIAPSFCEPHIPLISEETWITVAKKYIEKKGADDFLRNLLGNLKGDYVPSQERP